MDPPRKRTRKKTLLPSYEYEFEPEEEKEKKKIFKCYICKRCVCDAGALRDHMKCHSNKLAYACQLCPHRTNTKKYLTRHIKNVHSDGNKTNCEICNQVLAKKSVQAHMRTHTGEKPYDCEVCGKKFASTYSLSTHKLIHTDEKPYECSFCEYACRDTSTLRKHQARHLGIERMYQCNLCDRKVKSKIHLKMHIAEQHLQLDVRKHECSHCDKRFKEKSQLKIHVEQVHYKSTTVTCEVCHVTISNKANLPAHMLKHISIRPYKCTFENCCKSYKDMHTLKRHQLIHYPERQLRCELCGRLFTRRSRLMTHLKHHTKKRKCVTCEQCGYSFYNKASLEVHVNRKHGNKRQKLACDSCGFTTYNKSLLIIHVTEHNIDVQKTYECKICQKKFKQEISLILHCAKYHKEKNAEQIHENPRVQVKIEPLDSDDDDIVLSDLIHKDCESQFDFLNSTKMEIESPKLEPQYRSSPELDDIQPSNTLTAPVEMQEQVHRLKVVNSIVDLNVSIEDVYEKSNEEFISKEVGKGNYNKTVDSSDSKAEMSTSIEILHRMQASPSEGKELTRPLIESLNDIKGKEKEKLYEIDDLVESIEQSNTDVSNSTHELIDFSKTVLNNTKQILDITKQHDNVESNTDNNVVSNKPPGMLNEDGNLSEINSSRIEANKTQIEISNVTIISPSTLGGNLKSFLTENLPQTCVKAQEFSTFLNDNFKESNLTGNEFNSDPVFLLENNSVNTISESQIPGPQDFKLTDSQAIKRQVENSVVPNAKITFEVDNSADKSSKVLTRFEVANSVVSSSDVLASFETGNSEGPSAKDLTSFAMMNSEASSSSIPASFEVISEALTTKVSTSFEAAKSEGASSKDLTNFAMMNSEASSSNIPASFEVNYAASTSKVSTSFEAANSKELNSKGTSKELEHEVPKFEVETIQITPDGYDIQNILNDEQQAALDVIKDNQRELKNVPEEMFDDVFLTHCLKEYEGDEVTKRKGIKYLYLDKRKKENQRKRVKQLIKKINKGEAKAEQSKSRNDLIAELIREIRADTTSNQKPNANDEINKISKIDEKNIPRPKIVIKKLNKDSKNKTNYEVITNIKPDDQSTASSQDKVRSLDECNVHNDANLSTDILEAFESQTNFNKELPTVALVKKSGNAKKVKTPRQSKNKTLANKKTRIIKPKTREHPKSNKTKEITLKNKMTNIKENLKTDEKIPCRNKINKKKDAQNVNEKSETNEHIEQDLDENEESETDNDSDYQMSEEDDNRAPKVTFNMHQCYVCFKLFPTKEVLLDHCKDHFDICNKKLLKKCPLCDYVSHSNLARHVYLIHGIKINLFGATMKERKQSNSSGYFLELRNKKIPDIEVIPSVKNLNKRACMEIDQKNRQEKDRTVAKSKLVKKGKEWVVIQEKINLESDDLIIPKVDNVDVTDYAEKMKKLSVAAKKEGKKILFPCNSCDKICRSMAALKLHLRRHNPDAKPFKKKVWKHKQNISETSEERSEILENEARNQIVNTDNRNAKPKPVRNNHKCDRKLIEFYHNNIKGKDIEFWQFLKIYNKMSRENIRDFKDLLESDKYGIHTYEDVPISEEIRKNNTITSENRQENIDTEILGTQKINLGKRNKIIDKIVKDCGNRKCKTDKVKKKSKKECLKRLRLSKTEMLRRNAIKDSLRDRIVKSKESL